MTNDNQEPDDFAMGILVALHIMHLHDYGTAGVEIADSVGLKNLRAAAKLSGCECDTDTIKWLKRNGARND